MRNVIAEQNQMIITLRKERASYRDVTGLLFGAVVKWKHEYSSGMTVVESTANYPDVRNEDLANLASEEIIKKVSHAFRATCTSLNEARSEIRSIYKELDHEVGDALDSWNAIKAQDDVENQKLAFRDNLFSQTQTARAPTPDLSTPPRPTGDRPHASSEFTPDSSNKGRAGQSEIGKSKAGTTTVEGMFGSPATSPTTAKTPTGRAPLKNGRV